MEKQFLLDYTKEECFNLLRHRQCLVRKNTLLQQHSKQENYLQFNLIFNEKLM